MKKRILALVLVLCLSVGLLATVASASAIFTPSSAADLIVRAEHNSHCRDKNCHYCNPCHSHSCTICYKPTCSGWYNNRYWCSDCGKYDCDHYWCSTCHKYDCTHLKAVSIKIPFLDVQVNYYYYDAACWANKCGVVNETKYLNPDKACSRADMITFLWRAAGSPKSALTYMPFTDVSESAYYCEAVQWALEAGITKGTNNLKFRPYETVTRAEVLTFLYRYAGVTTSAKNPYTDVSENDWFYDAVRWADSCRITNGTNNLQFRPYDTCTRSQALTFLYRYFG